MLSVQEQTKLEFEEKIRHYKRCAVVRPTGLGKTYMFSNYAKGRRTLFVLPRVALEKDMKSRFEWLKDETMYQFITYQKLLSMYKKKANFKKEFGNLEFICFDEMHRAGAELWTKAVKKLMSAYSDIQIAGGSATPVRCDGKNVVDELFSGIQLSKYTLVDAITDGVLPKPRYVVALCDLVKEFERIKSIKVRDDVDVDELLTSVFNNFRNYMETLDIPSIIRNNVDKQDSMRFIVFFSDIESLNQRKETVEGWFKKAYPDYNIESYAMYSGLKDNASTLKKFSGKCEKHKVRLLFSVDMISEGVHVKNTSGVVLLRKTDSHILFSQQIGRCIESGIEGFTPIVFDFVNNISNSYKYQLNSKSEQDLYSVLDVVDYTEPIEAQFKRVEAVAKVSVACKFPLDIQIKMAELASQGELIRNIAKIVNLKSSQVEDFLYRIGIYRVNL